MFAILGKINSVILKTTLKYSENSKRFQEALSKIRLLGTAAFPFPMETSPERGKVPTDLSSPFRFFSQHYH